MYIYILRGTPLFLGEWYYVLLWLCIIVCHIQSTKMVAHHFNAFDINPFAAEVIFIQCTKKQIIMKIIGTRSHGYSYESSRWVLSDEYPFARVSVIFQVFLHHFVLDKLATSSIRVNKPVLCGRNNLTTQEISSRRYKCSHFFFSNWKVAQMYG